MHKMFVNDGYFDWVLPETRDLFFVSKFAILRKLEFVTQSLYDDFYDTDKNYLYHGACGL